VDGWSFPSLHPNGRKLLNDATDGIGVHRFVDTAKVLKHFDTSGTIEIPIAFKKINQS
jgi:hypothetical protein